MKTTLAIALLGALLALGQQPDNTRTNERDRQGNQPTADSQKMNKADTDLVKKIRDAITKDKNLSTYAHNVKVVAMNGMVTLRGPVRTETEKDAIESKAVTIAGTGKVDNRLDIMRDSK